jgi:hypothetical protein
MASFIPVYFASDSGWAANHGFPAGSTMAAPGFLGF